MFFHQAWLYTQGVLQANATVAIAGNKSQNDKYNLRILP